MIPIFDRKINTMPAYTAKSSTCCMSRRSPNLVLVNPSVKLVTREQSQIWLHKSSPTKNVTPPMNEVPSCVSLLPEGK